MLIKRPIYNQELQRVAYELIVNKSIDDVNILQQKFHALIKSTESQSPIFVPYALREMLQELADDEHPFILKLHASDINIRFPQAEIEKNNFSIALLIDDIKQLPWIGYADYVVLNEQLVRIPEAHKVVMVCHQKGRKVIGYDVSTNDEFEICKKLEIDFFCGDFINKPKDKKNPAMAANKFFLIELVNMLHQEVTNFEQVSSIIQKDPLMSYQLLKLVNSAAFSGYDPIESIEQAVVRLGFFNLKNWVMVLSMRNVSEKPIEVVESGLIRAHMAEKLAEANPLLRKESAYTAGLLSILDSLLDTPMQELLEKITLADDIKFALLTKGGELGELLKIVVNYESGSWENLSENEYHGMDLGEVYITCLEWAAAGKTALTEHY